MNKNDNTSLVKRIFKFRQFNSKYISLYLFQRGRWELGFTLDINGGMTSEPDWSTWLFSINMIYVYIELHNHE